MKAMLCKMRNVEDFVLRFLGKESVETCRSKNRERIDKWLVEESLMHVLLLFYVKINFLAGNSRLERGANKVEA